MVETKITCQDIIDDGGFEEFVEGKELSDNSSLEKIPTIEIIGLGYKDCLPETINFDKQLNVEDFSTPQIPSETQLTNFCPIKQNLMAASMLATSIQFRCDNPSEPPSTSTPLPLPQPHSFPSHNPLPQPNPPTTSNLPSITVIPHLYHSTHTPQPAPKITTKALQKIIEKNGPKILRDIEHRKTYEKDNEIYTYNFKLKIQQEKMEQELLVKYEANEKFAKMTRRFAEEQLCKIDTDCQLKKDAVEN